MPKKITNYDKMLQNSKDQLIVNRLALIMMDLEKNANLITTYKQLDKLQRDIMSEKINVK